jgi:transcriptional regulator with XRE-family HTH domain
VTTFGQTLYRYRVNPEAARRRVLSQAQLAEMIGFDHSYVSRLESGGRQPSRHAVILLAEALELTGNDRAELFLSANYAPDKPGQWISGERFTDYPAKAT